MSFDQKSIIDLNQFEGTIWSKYNTMEQTCQNYDFGLRGEEIRKKKPEKTNKCNQCDYASSYPSALKLHLKTHSGEKPNKCNQCDFACSDPSSLRTHMKTHSGEKSNKCDQCDYASSQTGHLRTHLITHSGETNATNVTLHPPMHGV